MYAGKIMLTCWFHIYWFF